MKKLILILLSILPLISFSQNRDETLDFLGDFFGIEIVKQDVNIKEIGTHNGHPVYILKNPAILEELNRERAKLGKHPLKTAESDSALIRRLVWAMNNIDLENYFVINKSLLHEGSSRKEFNIKESYTGKFENASISAHGLAGDSYSKEDELSRYNFTCSANLSRFGFISSFFGSKDHHEIRMGIHELSEKADIYLSGTIIFSTPVKDPDTGEISMHRVHLLYEMLEY